MHELTDYDVFLSFKGAPKAQTASSHVDTNSNRIADLLKIELQQNLAITTFHFTHDVAPGAEFLQVITQTIKAAKAVVILLSNAYVDVDSHFCRHELSITREVKDPRSQSIFSTDPGFVPSNHPTILAGVSAPDISDWQGGLGNPFVKSAAYRIADAISRSGLKMLIDILAEVDSAERDDQIMDWCFTWGDDPAAKYWRTRLASRLWRRKFNSNKQQFDGLKQIVKIAEAAFISELNEEKEFLSKLEDSATKGSLSREDWRLLKTRHEVDFSRLLSTSDHSPEKIRKLEGELATAQANLNNASDELEKAKRDLNFVEREDDSKTRELAKYKKLYDDLQVEAARLRKPETDELEALLSAIRYQSVAASETNLRTAWKYRESARSVRSDGDTLMTEIESLIRTDRSRPPIQAGQFLVHHFPAEDGAPGRFWGRQSLSRPPARGIHKRRVYGHFDDWGVFKGVGAIEFAEGATVIARYLGEIDGLSPRTGGFGVYSFVPRPLVRAREWEGSVSPTSAIGRLVRDDGSVFWGPVLSAGFGIFHEHGFGVLEAGRNALGNDAVVAGEWKHGQAV
jgi:hypothetical protein